MSNKTLSIIVAVIVILFAGGIYGYRVYSNRQAAEVEGTEPEASTPPGSTELQQAAQQQATTTPQQPTNQPAMNQPTAGNCQRNFNPDTLKNAKVDIANRTVEMDIKDFGKVQVQLYDKDAPKTVENFLRLTNAGYYNCLTFHRIAQDFVIQGGDPTGTGSGGDSAFGGEFADELNPETPSYKAGYVKGVLAMANRGPNTNTSQFFIMLADRPLPNNYTIFGKVIAGQDVVDKIGKVPVTPQMGPTDGAPKVPVVMESVKIIK